MIDRPKHNPTNTFEYQQNLQNIREKTERYRIQTWKYLLGQTDAIKLKKNNTNRKR